MERKSKIVLTGGPGGGKTTALDLFRRELHDKIVVVPEAATTLFTQGIKRGQDVESSKRVQVAIYHLQKNFEKIYQNLHPNIPLLCDRGTLDGLAYWPADEKNFFDAIGSTLEQELSRYDAVIFFQTAAACGDNIKSNNPHRVESAKESIELDRKLQLIWRKHPHFHYVDSSESFVKKIVFGINTIHKVLGDHHPEYNNIKI